MLQIKQDDKFFSRLLSKEKNSKDSSFRFLYYGKSCGSVPFTWESQPGTPLHPSSHSSLPPLTPPPSYQSTNTTPKTKSTQKGSKPNFLFTIFPRKASKKSHVSQLVPSSCSSGSFSSPSTPMTACVRRRGWRLRSRSTNHFGVDDDNEPAAGSPTSTQCFGGRHGFFKESRGSRSTVNVQYPL